MVIFLPSTANRVKSGPSKNYARAATNGQSTNTYQLTGHLAPFPEGQLSDFIVTFNSDTGCSCNIILFDVAVACNLKIPSVDPDKLDCCDIQGEPLDIIGQTLAVAHINGIPNHHQFQAQVAGGVGDNEVMDDLHTPTRIYLAIKNHMFLYLFCNFSVFIGVLYSKLTYMTQNSIYLQYNLIFRPKKL